LTAFALPVPEWRTNILMRRLNREFINLSFSGNGQLDYEIAEIMAQCDASLYYAGFYAEREFTADRRKNGKILLHHP
jgi:hypothetical protein